MAPQLSACLRCHKHKVGCTPTGKGRPCRRCSAAGVPCEPQQTRQSKHETIEAMKEEIAHLHAQLAEVRRLNQDDSPTTASSSSHIPSAPVSAYQRHSTPSSPSTAPLGVRSIETCTVAETYQLVSDAEARVLLAFFFQHMARCFPMLTHQHGNPATLRQECPALLFAICAVAGRHVSTSSSDLPFLLWDKALRLLQSSLFNFSPAVQQGPLDVLALCLCAMHPTPSQDPDEFSQDRVTFSYMLIGHAIRLAQALDLLQPPPPSHSLPTDQQDLNTRTAIGVFVLDHIFSLSMGRPPTLPISRGLVAMRDQLATSPRILPSDHFAIAMFDLQSLHREAVAALDQLTHDVLVTANKLQQFECDVHNWYEGFTRARGESLPEPLFNIITLQKQHTLISVLSRSISIYLKSFVTHIPVDFTPFVSKTIRIASSSGKTILALSERRPLNLHLSYAPGVYLVAYPALLLLQLASVELFSPFFIGLDIVSDCLRLRDVLAQSIRYPQDTIATVTAYITAALSQHTAGTRLEPEEMSRVNPSVLLARTKALAETAKSAAQQYARLMQQETRYPESQPDFSLHQAAPLFDNAPLVFDESWLWSNPMQALSAGATGRPPLSVPAFNQ